MFLASQYYLCTCSLQDDLSIEKPCGRTASEDLAEFMCSSRSLRSLTIDLTQVTGTIHDVFYSVLANKSGDAKVSINLCFIHVVVYLIHHSLKRKFKHLEFFLSTKKREYYIKTKMKRLNSNGI